MNAAHRMNTQPARSFMSAANELDALRNACAVRSTRALLIPPPKGEGGRPRLAGVGRVGADAARARSASARDLVHFKLQNLLALPAPSPPGCLRSARQPPSPSGRDKRFIWRRKSRP